MPPTSPSATAQRGEVITLPALLCASCQFGLGHHIARSAMIGTVDVMRIDIAASASCASSKSTDSVLRLCAATMMFSFVSTPPPAKR